MGRQEGERKEGEKEDRKWKGGGKGEGGKKRALEGLT